MPAPRRVPLAPFGPWAHARPAHDIHRFTHITWLSGITHLDPIADLHLINADPSPASHQLGLVIDIHRKLFAILPSTMAHDDEPCCRTHRQRWPLQDHLGFAGATSHLP